MRLDSIRLYNFRNFVACDASFSPSVNAFLGDNGQGKTNLIEAIGVLSFAKSFRSQTNSELIRWGESEASVFGKITKSAGEEELGVVFKGGKRETLLNGNKLKSIEDFVGRLICVSFSPSDMSIVQGSPQERRRFIDKHLTEARPAMLRRLMDYSRALKNKNAVLQDDSARLETVRPWNQILAETGTEIINSRRALLSRLEDLARGFQSRISGDAPLSLKLKTNLCPDDIEVNRDAAFHALETSFHKERLRGQAMYGPHRDDIEILLGDKEAGSFASQGQTRTIVLSLKLGMIQLLEETRGESPIVLLDDVDSELDAARRNSLFELVLEQSRQVFITGTELRFFSKNTLPDARMFTIKEGVIAAREDWT